MTTPVTATRLAASIDIGTNSVLLLVAETDGRTIRVLDEKQAVPRLGRGVDKSRKLHPDSMERVLRVLKDYKTFLENSYPGLEHKVTVAATSAARDASNRADFMQMIKEETGWEIRLLSGEEEAQFTYRGAVSVLPPSEGTRCVLDIGGGSTEIAFGKGQNLLSYISLDIGSVRFSERYLKTDLPKPEDINRARKAAREALLDVTVPAVAGSTQAVGVAGTVTSIASIKAGHDKYLPEKLNNSTLDAETIQAFIRDFSCMPAEQIEKKYPVFMKGRGDVITGGLIILQEFLSWQNLDGITVSTGGIRHGALLSE
ncbi:Ppx/GppA phosphatase family protein [Rhodohalobacter mucosus]|uniref:Ppx/GppA family phosphatase n=1 Tax=Rhodohalobacter mucosus TaxID=2079485 RepID=A0A316TQY2_9BACT|nr:Ppx/GppA phosphatase family protein [Rhodohalobacter mucosus]PWN07023.1 Ppx/GppA family phosphatase [Rhodohalobacter mucosus]